MKFLPGGGSSASKKSSLKAKSDQSEAGLSFEPGSLESEEAKPKGLINIMKKNFAKFGTSDPKKFSSMKFD